MKSFALLSLLLACVPGHAFAFSEKKTSAQYWRETGLSTEVALDAMKLLDNCYASPETFRGCFAALNALAARTKPKTQFVPNALIGAPLLGFGESEESGPAFTRVRVETLRDKNEKARLFTERFLSQRAAITKELNKLYEQTKPVAGDPEAPENKAKLINFEAPFRALLPAARPDMANDALLAAEAINAFFQAKDAHAHLDPRAEVLSKEADSTLRFGGIGVNLKNLGGAVVIVSLLKGMPAERGGIKAKDRIVAVNGRSTEGLTANEVAEKVRGPEKTPVALRVLRDGAELNLEIERETIEQKTFESSVEENFGEKTGVLTLTRFSERRSCKLMAAEIKRLTDEERVSSLVLDFRSNPGGLIDSALCIGGLFLGKEKVITKEKNLETGVTEPLLGTHAKITDLPLIVLLDAGSASASELVAGALQDHGRAWVVGERSFGKGSVQSPGEFLSSGTMLFYKTIARFYQPNGGTNQMRGITANFERPDKPDDSEDDRFALREEDLMPHALPADGPAWVETRVKERDAINQCVADGRRADTRYRELVAAEDPADYRLLSAQEIFACERGTQ